MYMESLNGRQDLLQEDNKTFDYLTVLYNATIDNNASIGGTLTLAGLLNGYDSSALFADITTLVSRGILNLPNDEITQLTNIDTNTITNAKWGYLGDLDQIVSSTASPSFAGLGLTGDLTTTGLLDGVDLGDFKADYDSKVDQAVKTTSSVNFNSVGATNLISGKGLVASTSGVSSSGTISGPLLSITNTTNQFYVGTAPNQTINHFPAGSGNITLSYPSITDTLVGRTTTDTLSNKTISGGILTGTTTLDSLSASLPLKTNASKQVITEAISLSGAEVSGVLPVAKVGISAGSNITISGAGVIAASGLVTLDGVETLTNKTLTSAIVATQLHLPEGIPIRFANGVASAHYAIKSDSTNGLQVVDNTIGFVPFRINGGFNYMLSQAGGLLKFDMAGATSGMTTTLDFNQTAARTITFPNASTTLVGTDTTDTLTNKTLTAPLMTTIIRGAGTLTLPTITDTLMTKQTIDFCRNKTFAHIDCFFVNTTDPSIQLKFLPTGTTGIQGTLRTNFTTAKTIEFPDASDTVMCNTTTAVVSNKSLDESNKFVLASDNTRWVNVVVANDNKVSTTLRFSGSTSGINLNVPNCSATSSFIMSAVASGSQTINNNLTCFQQTLTGWLKFPTSGGTAAALDFYENTYSQNINWWLVGAAAAVLANSTVYFRRIGDMVTMTFPTLTHTPGGSGSGYYQNSTGLIPTRYRPNATAGHTSFVVRCSNNSGAYAAGLCSVKTDGYIEFNPTLPAGSVFGTTGTNTIWNFSATWFV